MATLAQNMADLLLATQAELGRLRFQQIYQTLQHYEVMSKWLKKEKVIFQNGVSIQRNIMIQSQESAASHVGLLDEDEVQLQNVMRTLSANWVHVQTKWAMVYQTDILMNSGKALIYDVIKPRRAAAIIDMAQELENRAWGSAPSTTNVKLPWGVQYYIVRNGTQGFTGGAPGSHTSVAGINPSVDTKWKNWSDTYSDEITKTGAVRSLRKAHRQTGFVSPVSVKDYRGDISSRYRMYVGEASVAEIEEIGEGQNESLGKDIASMDGKMVFRGHPIIWVPKLDADTGQPVYFIDHSTFYPVCLEGDYLREGDAQQAPNQHNVFQTFVDMTYQFLCVDRRRNAVVYKV